jgi:ABC-type glycerol-3-phosphate transport system substrate-binding protein
MKKIIIVSLLACVGCVNNNKYSYEVHLKNGTGTMHLYTGHDYKDAKSYVKEYEESHGDLKIVPVVKN